MWLNHLRKKNECITFLDEDIVSAPASIEVMSVWQDLGECMRKRLDLPVSGHEMIAAATLLYDPVGYGGSAWSSLGRKHSATKPSATLKKIQEIQEALRKFQIHEERGGRVDPATFQETKDELRDVSGLLWREIRLAVIFHSDDPERPENKRASGMAEVRKSELMRVAGSMLAQNAAHTALGNLHLAANQINAGPPLGRLLCNRLPGNGLREGLRSFPAQLPIRSACPMSDPKPRAVAARSLSADASVL